MSRKLARENAMTLIYQMDINKVKALEALESFFENLEEDLNEEEVKYIKSCVTGVEENLERIDGYIEKYLKGSWKMSRVARVDLAIMRLGVYEMLEREDVPDIVAVNEAVELAKRFGGDESKAFVNGILGNIIKEISQNA